MKSLDCQIYFGEATNAEARVYAEFTRPTSADGPTDATLDEPLDVVGSVRGPSCAYAHTLPSRVKFQVGPTAAVGERLLAEAIIPDPCFWTPELPQLYDVQLELKSGEQVLATVTQQLGIRRLGTSGRDLLLDAHRWVVRAISDQHAGTSDGDVEQQMSVCHDAPAAILWRNPTDEVCQLASQLGVLLIADLQTSSDLLSQLHRLSHHAAVAIAIMPSEAVSPDELNALSLRSGRPKNLLLGKRLRDSDDGDRTDWADVLIDVLIIDATNAERCARLAADFRLPALACRPLATATSIAEARAACDALQRDLAPHGDFAGYIV